MQTKILVIEDDNAINKVLCELLEEEGYWVQAAYSGTEALIYIKQEKWDMVLLDLMLPGKSGEEVIVEIREQHHMPILIISAKESKEAKIELLKSGADDFITKPFDLDELLARVEANLRRCKQFSGKAEEELEVLRYEEIYLDKTLRTVMVNDCKVTLTTREFEILRLLMAYPKKVFSKVNLFESVWKGEYLGDDNTINVHISNIRSKLAKGGAKKEYIQTIWGIGYKLET